MLKSQLALCSYWMTFFLDYSNNRSYRILKLNILQYWNEQGIQPNHFPNSFDLCHPELRFDRIAESIGVRAVRVEKPEQIEGAIALALAHQGPFLIDIVFNLWFKNYSILFLNQN